MYALPNLLQSIGAFGFVACIIWLHWRALKDGAIQDVLLFLTGISIVSYIFCRWDRAKYPVLGLIGASLLFGIMASLSSRVAMTSDEPSPEEIATEVKSLILQEWQKDPELRNATLQNISLSHKGGGHYSGFIEATLDGQPERLSLQVMFDRGSIRWEIKPGGN